MKAPPQPTLWCRLFHRRHWQVVSAGGVSHCTCPTCDRSWLTRIKERL